MNDFFCQPCIAAMPALKFWLTFIVTSGFSLVSLLAARNSFIRARLIEDIPTSRIRSASQGFVELVGAATGQGQTLPAPLTVQPCLWWRYRIERYRKNGKSSSWATVSRGISDQPFFMDDNSGLCRIEPKGAEIFSLHRKVWYGHTQQPETAAMAFDQGIISQLMSTGFSHRYRYTEYLIREGDPLYLLGHFVSDASGQRTLTIDQIAGQLIRLWKRDYPQFLIRFDSDGNGILDEKEWSTAQVAARHEAETVRHQNSSREVEHLLRKPEDSGLPFLIGSHGQDQLSSKFRWRAFGSAFLFLATGSMASWLISSRFLLP